MNNLPDELVLEILTWLPTKSIARFRCVSKIWKTLFHSPSFIRAHLQHSINGRDPSIFIMYDDKDLPTRNFPPFTSRKVYTMLRSETAYSDSRNILKRNFPDFGLYPETSFGLSLVGSINGLICLRSQYVIHIWNPSLHEYFTLPPFRTPLVKHFEHVFYGFGLDATTDDYVVVKFMFNFAIKVSYEIVVYRCNKGYWEIISPEVVPSHLHGLSNREGVNLNGSIHWLGYENESVRMVLFDLTGETFGEISLPHNRSGGDNLLLCLLKGHLALFSYRSNECCELWVMKEYGVHQSWVREHVITNDAVRCIVHTPLGFSGRGEFLLMNEEGRLLSYDPESKQAKHVGITVDRNTSCCVTYYVDSLLSFAIDYEPYDFDLFDEFDEFDFQEGFRSVLVHDFSRGQEKEKKYHS